MTDFNEKYDKNDPKIATKLAYVEELNARTAAKIASWQDMYDELRNMGRGYMDDPTKETADLTILAFMSFMLALEQLPDEGDIAVIARKMNEIMVMRTDLTGATVYVGEEADQQRATAALMGAAVMAQVITALSQQEESPKEAKATTVKPVLH